MLTGVSPMHETPTWLLGSGDGDDTEEGHDEADRTAPMVPPWLVNED